MRKITDHMKLGVVQSPDAHQISTEIEQRPNGNKHTGTHTPGRLVPYTNMVSRLAAHFRPRYRHRLRRMLHFSSLGKKVYLLVHLRTSTALVVVSVLHEFIFVPIEVRLGSRLA